jgi:hypothetical protein
MLPIEFDVLVSDTFRQLIIDPIGFVNFCKGVKLSKYINEELKLLNTVKNLHLN